MTKTINFLNGVSYTLPEPDERGHYAFEYVDREHNVICAAMFVKIDDHMVGDDLVGKRFISPRHGCDGTHNIPIIYTVLKVSDGSHLRFSKDGASIAYDQCFLELE